jgi:hypothetical protein
VLGRRGDEVFAADERTDGMDGAGLVDQERTGNALVVVFDGEALMGFRISGSQTSLPGS